MNSFTQTVVALANASQTEATSRLRMMAKAALAETPVGWTLVPVEPTREMLHAATMVAPTWDDEASARKWAAMLAVAPKP